MLRSLLALLLVAAPAFARAGPAAAPPTLEAVFLKDYSDYQGGGSGAPGPYYPAAAVASGVEGDVVIQCTLTVSGRLRACTGISEDPAGVYFGAMALTMARSGVISAKPPAPLTADEVVRVHVPFALTR